MTVMSSLSHGMALSENDSSKRPVYTLMRRALGCGTNTRQASAADEAAQARVSGTGEGVMAALADAGQLCQRAYDLTMADIPSVSDNRPPPHPSARVIAEALAGISCVVVGQLIGEVVQHVFDLWIYTPEVFIALSVIVLPRIMRWLGYRMPPKPADRPQDPQP